MVKILFFIFSSAFLANLVWENIHSHLYTHYKGREITQLILLKAALFDAVVITILGALYLYVPFFQQRPWVVILIALLFAIGLELFALHTNRWAYNSSMPIIPILRVGLTPTVQLALLAYVIFRMMGR